MVVNTRIVFPLLFLLLLGTAAAETVDGIDVSNHQGDINWTAVYEAGYRFAFVKATEGVDFNDSRFIQNMNNGSAAGLLMGAYHFATPYTDGVNDAADEACDFVDRIRPYLRAGFLRPVLDLERGEGLSTSVLSQWVHDFMNTVINKTNVTPIIYMNANYATNEVNSSVTIYDLWVAHYTGNVTILPSTGLWNNWSFWQYTDEGAVPGIGGDVDLDLFNGTLDELNESFTVAQFSTGGGGGGSSKCNWDVPMCTDGPCEEIIDFDQRRGRFI